jgi:hypothetical protein
MGGREAASWGLVGALSFLVLALGFQLATQAAIDVPVLLGVAVVVGAVSAVASAVLRRRIEGGAGNESP